MEPGWGEVGDKGAALLGVGPLLGPSACKGQGAAGMAGTPGPVGREGLLGCRLWGWPGAGETGRRT